MIPVPISITSADGTSFTIGKTKSFTVTATGDPTPVITMSGDLPLGIGFVPHADGTATLAGTPAAGTGGHYPLTFTASNGVAADAEQEFILTVVPTARTTVTLVSSRNPAPASVQVRFTARVGFFTRAFGTPTGTVEFNVDGGPLGLPVRLLSTQAVSQPMALSAGLHTVVARYSGDGNFIPSSAALQQKMGF